MRRSTNSDHELLSATTQGRTCAAATKGTRDLRSLADAYRDLFPDPPFDQAMLNAIALSTAFVAPWCGAEQLRIANRSSLWVFAEDRMMETTGNVDAVVADCLSIADGAAPAQQNHLGQLLAEIRDEIATVPAFASGHAVWRNELERMLTADARERDWTVALSSGNAARMPTFEVYLGNADCLGVSFVNASHWIFTGDQDTIRSLDQLIVAGRAVQRVLRLTNDVASYHREVKAGDINSLLLGVDRAEIKRQITLHIERCREIIEPLEARCRHGAAYLLRIIGFTTAFYSGTDFWGDGDR